ncbi:alpha/beta hydrolase [Labrys okinawensis]|uniref:alpha/beta hydrolase n=1 Tax=Labrys okinawensis TaxID=346911 RepID=UPI0039BCC98D
MKLFILEMFSVPKQYTELRAIDLCRLLGLCALIICGLSACAGQATNVLVVGQPKAVAGTSTVDMLVASTRAPTVIPGQVFGGDRGLASFAEIEVSIPPHRSSGTIQWPSKLPANPATDFTAVKVDVVDRSDIIDALHRRLTRSRNRNVLLFVHGFNNRFDAAVYRFAQIVHDSGTDAVPVLFTWPSAGELTAYGYDRDSATYSRTALEKTLDYLIQDKSVASVSILAHSMGNWVTLEALRQMAIRRGSIPKKVENVMLASADVDIDVFETQVADMGTQRPAFTVFVASDDRALEASKILWQSKSRLGDINPNVQPYAGYMKAHNIDIVNLSDVKTSGFIHHDKFAASGEIVSLIGKQIATGQPISDESIGLTDVIAMGAAQTALKATTLARPLRLGSSVQ